MEQPPDIRMRCPKCRRDYPMEAVYCDDCSAMLEPEEVAAAGVQPAEEEKRTVQIKSSASDETAISTDAIEDVEIENLRADIEIKFVVTLLRELDQLRKRLAAKEAQLSGAAASGEESGRPARIGGLEADINELLRKITKTESILENLRDKIGADIGMLETRLAAAERPGIAGMFTDAGKYHRMLSSELRTKKKLFDVIQNKRATGSLSGSTTSVLLAVLLIAVVAGGGYAAYVMLRPAGTAPAAAKATPAPPAAAGITEDDIMKLLEDIRQANVQKNAALWESRYSRQYLAAKDKKESILDQWAKYDYAALAYTLSDVRTGPDAASAVITWNMELTSTRDHATRQVVQTLQADFVREDGVLKIAAVKKQ